MIVVSEYRAWAVTWRVLAAVLALFAAYACRGDAPAVFSTGYLCAVVLEPAWRIAFRWASE